MSSKVEACFLCQNEGNYSGNKLENNLKVIFLLRELLGVSFDLCVTYLQKYGDPSAWIRTCSSCQEVISKGQNIFKKIKQLEEQLQDIKTEVRCQAKVKNELEQDFCVIVPEAGKEILQDFLEQYRQESDESLSFMDFEINPDPEILEEIEIKDEPADDNFSDVNEEVITVNDLHSPTTRKKKTKAKQRKKKVKRKLFKKKPRGLPRKIPKKVDQPMKIEASEEEDVEEVPEKDGDYSPENNQEDSDSSFNVEDDKEVTFVEKSGRKKKKKQTHVNPLPPKKKLNEKKAKYEKLGRFPCPLESCDKMLSERKFLEDHYRSHHLPRSALTCNGCGKICTPKQDYKFHLNQAASESTCLSSSLKCSICDVLASSQEALDTHFQFNHMLSLPILCPYKCQTCGRDFASIVVLRRHQIQYCGENARKIPKPDKNFPCVDPDCRESFANIQFLNSHMRISHPDSNYEPPAKKEKRKKTLRFQSFLCPEESCGKSFSFFFLENHVMGAHLSDSATRCPGCNENIACHRKFKKHLELKVNEDCAKAALKCPQCHVKTQSKETLELHTKIFHIGSNILPYKCDLCEKSFTLNSSLLLHKREHHGIDLMEQELNKKNCPEVRTFPCGICKKVFKRRCHRNRHEMLHREENPYLCSLCGKCFKMQNYLTIHMWSHDPDRHLKYSLYKKKGADQPKYRKGSGANQRVKVVPTSQRVMVHTSDIPQEEEDTSNYDNTQE